MKTLTLSFLLLAGFVSAHVSAADTPPEEILVLSQFEIAYYRRALEAVKASVTSQNVIFREVDLKNKQQLSRLENSSITLILAIGTPSAKYAATHFVSTPTIFSFVLNPEKVGITLRKNITGISTRIDPKRFIDQALKFQPELKSIGVLYTPDLFQSYINELASYASKNGVEIVAKPVRSRSQFSRQLKSSIKYRIDLFLILPDSGIYDSNAFRYTLLETYKAGIPCIGTTASLVKSAALWGFSVTPQGLGAETGQLINEVIQGRKIGHWKYTKTGSLLVNLLTARKLGISLTSDSLANDSIILFGEEGE